VKGKALDMKVLLWAWFRSLQCFFLGAIVSAAAVLCDDSRYSPMLTTTIDEERPDQKSCYGFLFSVDGFCKVAMGAHSK
jgi:hypothetical protein